jgi:hypothetical protein
VQVHQESVAASATCASPACDRINIKIINFSSMQQRVAGACLNGFYHSFWVSVSLLMLYSWDVVMAVEFGAHSWWGKSRLRVPRLGLIGCFTSIAGWACHASS